VDEKFFGRRGAGEAADGVAAEIQLASDVPQGVGLNEQLMDGGMPVTGADRDPIPPGLRRATRLRDILKPAVA
jgi:hypothetical protein